MPLKLFGMHKSGIWLLFSLMLLAPLARAESAESENERNLPLNALAPGTTFVANTDLYYPSEFAYFQFGQQVASSALNRRKPYCQVATGVQRKVYFRKGDEFRLKSTSGGYSAQTTSPGQIYYDHSGELAFEDYRLSIWCDFEVQGQTNDLTVGEVEAALGQVFSIKVIPAIRPEMPAGPQIDQLIWKYLKFNVDINAGQDERRYIQNGTFTEKLVPGMPYCYFERPDGKAFVVEGGKKLGVIGARGSYETPANFFRSAYEDWLLFNIGPSNWNYSLRLVCQASTPYYRLTIDELRSVLGPLVELP